MPRAAGRKRRPARVEVFFFPKNGRGVRKSGLKPRSRTLSLPGVSEVPTEPHEQPDFPTEPFYVPDFLANMQDAHAAPRPADEQSLWSVAPVRPRGSGGRGRRASLLPKLGREELKRHLKKGRALFAEGKLHEARTVFETLVASGTTDAYAHTMLGTVYLALGDSTRSLALFDAALRLDPEDVVARVYRGEIHLLQGRVESALEDLNLAVRVGRSSDPFVRRAVKLIGRARAAPPRAAARGGL